MTTPDNLPTLYSITKSKDVQTWRVWVTKCTVYTEFGRLGGALQTSHKVCSPTNEGRSNERNPDAQAIFEAKAMHQKRIDCGYRTTAEAAKEVTFGPMLAGKFPGREDKVKYPVYVQVKLDGVRCLTYWDGDDLVFQSRGGKPLPMFPHLVKDIKSWLPKDWVLDGELFSEVVPFQKIISYVKRLQPDSSKLQYWIYDLAMPGLPYSKRMTMLKQLFASLGPEEGARKTSLVRVLSVTADSSERVYELQCKFVSRGFEGAMVRTDTGQYAFGNRSFDLLKVKTFDTDEFKIKSVREGRGKMKGKAIFTCVVNKTDTFDCTLNANHEYLAAIYKDRKKIIGKDLTVRFFKYTDAHIPRFPKGLAIRDYE